MGTNVSGVKYDENATSEPTFKAVVDWQRCGQLQCTSANFSRASVRANCEAALSSCLSLMPEALIGEAEGAVPGKILNGSPSGSLICRSCKSIVSILLIAA